MAIGAAHGDAAMRPDVTGLSAQAAKRPTAVQVVGVSANLLQAASAQLHELVQAAAAVQPWGCVQAPAAIQPRRCPAQAARRKLACTKRRRTRGLNCKFPLLSCTPLL